MIHEAQRGEYSISTDIRRLDLEVIHDFLSASYWAEGRPLDVVIKSIQNSLAFGLYKGGRQIGFARVVTDYSTFAYLADVFVLPEWRGQGLGVWLMREIISHRELQGLRRWLLVTRDAHDLYRRFGFEASTVGNVMEMKPSKPPAVEESRLSSATANSSERTELEHP